MSKLPRKKQDKKIGSKGKTVEDVLDCTKKCTGFPYGCLDCSEEPVWRKK
jgi:hypothetical protein